MQKRVGQQSGGSVDKDIIVAGAYGGKSKDMSTTTILVGEHIAIDAGNILSFLGSAAYQIDHILLTHSHFDHILDIPFLIDVFFERREHPLVVYGSKETLEDLRKYVFNWHIWPDFNEISLIKTPEKAIMFQEIEPFKPFVIDGLTIEAVPSNHTVTCFGYVIKNDKKGFYFTSDTYANPAMWERLNNDKQITKFITDVSFPSRLDKLARDSKHMTPKILSEELKNLKRAVDLYIFHLKPSYYEEVCEELKNMLGDREFRVLSDGYKLDTL